MLSALALAVGLAFGVGDADAEARICDPSLSLAAFPLQLCLRQASSGAPAYAVVHLCRLDSGKELCLSPGSDGSVSACLPRADYLLSVEQAGALPFQLVLPATVPAFSATIPLADDPGALTFGCDLPDEEPFRPLSYVFSESLIKATPSRHSLEGVLSIVPGVILTPR